MKVKVFNSSDNELPAYKTEQSAGLDLCAKLSAPVVIDANRVMLIPTGLKMEIPKGYELQIRPRSGLALNHCISLLNTPGTIDADYRGDVGVILINLSPLPFVVHPGDRIAQAVLSKFEKIEWEIVASEEDLTSTERGEGGFGHTGI